MRIVLVNWAKIWDGAGHGGGVNGYCQGLAIEFLKRGHDVVSLCGGVTYTPEPAAMEIRRHPDWLGVRVFEVINSPVMAPSIVQFREPMAEVSSPELEAAVGRLFAALKPDVVHWHNIEGFSVGCVAASRAAGAKVIYSLHNYHPICPQVYLMQGHREPCFDYRNGNACIGCIQTPSPTEERTKRVEKLVKAGSAAGSVAERREAAVRELRSAVGWPWRAVKAGMELARLRGEEEAAVRLPGVPVASERDVNGELRGALALGGAAGPTGSGGEPAVAGERRAKWGGDTRGQTQAVLDELEPRPGRPPDSSELRPILNVIQPEPVAAAGGPPPTAYAERRAAMVGMLSGCDRVLAVSSFVREKYVSMGVDAARIGTLHIGTRVNQIVRHAGPLRFDPPAFDASRPRPVRVVFMGYNHYYKGLGMFAEALETLAPEHMAKIDLSVYALDGQSIEWMFRRMEPRLARLTFSCGYRYQDIPWMLGGKDLGVVPSVWWDNAPQTVFEFMSCGLPVLGAEVGGIPDFVRHGVNGLLFRGNDRADLARRLVEVLDNPSVLDRLRRAVRPPKEMDVHCGELERVYADPAGAGL